MTTQERQKHWNAIYGAKTPNEVSWFEPTAATSLHFVHEFNLSKAARIIDIGGGDSFFADHLLREGYQNITVLDVSSVAIEKAKKRLGEEAKKVTWIVADIASFVPVDTYDFWHDRATFHFLTEEQEVQNYVNTVRKSLSKNGVVVIGTFSDEGPAKCSGIEIKQYTEVSMADRLKAFFNKIKCIAVEHITPSLAVQNFIFCSFRKRPV